MSMQHSLFKSSNGKWGMAQPSMLNWARKLLNTVPTKCKSTLDTRRHRVSSWHSLLDSLHSKKALMQNIPIIHTRFWSCARQRVSDQISYQILYTTIDANRLVKGKAAWIYFKSGLRDILLSDQIKMTSERHCISKHWQNATRYSL